MEPLPDKAEVEFDSLHILLNFAQIYQDSLRTKNCPLFRG